MKIYVTHTFYTEYGKESAKAARTYDKAMEAAGFRKEWANIEMDNQFVVYSKTIEDKQ